MSSTLEAAVIEPNEESEMYRHLSEDRVNDLKGVGATSEQIRKADHAGKKEIDDRLHKHVLDETTGQYAAVQFKKITVGVIGTIGAGKSATGNTLLGKKKFKETTSAMSVSNSTETFQSEHLQVVDTPGSWGVVKDPKIDIYVLVINLASPRFAKKDWDQVQALRDFNNVIKSKRCILLLTHASDALQGRSLYEYVQEIRGDPLYNFIENDMKRGRVMAINNNCSTQYEADQQHMMVINRLMTTYDQADMNPESATFISIDAVVDVAYALKKILIGHPKAIALVGFVLATVYAFYTLRPAVLRPGE